MKRLLAALAIAAAMAGAGGRAAAADLRAPAVRYALRVLPNGLKVLSAPDPSRPEVAVQLWYDVGSKDDPPGRAGFAHLFEHLMFKGSPDLPPEYMDQFTESVGGSSNATTTDDYTAYQDLVPAAQLERALWAEAARMNALSVDAASFKAERAVVEQEVREVFADDPYGRLFMQDIPQASFAARAFRQSPAGSIHDLEAATLADVAAFQALYYRPDNAALIVVGDFDPAQLQAWVDRYFGVLRAPDTPVPRLADREPPRRAARRVEIAGRSAPAPAVVVSYAGPPAASPDAAALRLLDEILTGGDSARGVSALVERRRIASEVFSEADLRRETGLIYFGAIMAPGHGVREGEAALRRELAWLGSHPVSRAELEAARNHVLAKTLAERETPDGLAAEIGEAALVGGDAALVNTGLAALQAVTAADIQRVARTYCIDRSRVTIRFGAGAARRGAEPPAPAELRWPPPTPRRVAVELPAPAATPAVTPAPALPVPVARSLPNGLRVIVAPSGALPLATAVLTVPGGAQLDPPGRAGLTDLTASLALRSAGGRPPRQLAEALAALGLKLSVEVDRTSSMVELTGLATALPQGLALLADVVRRPSLPQPELRRLLAERAGENADASADDVTDAALQALVFPRPAAPRAATPGPPSRADVLRQARRLWRPDQATLVVTGAVEPSTTFLLARGAFGDWTSPDAAAPPAQAPGAAAKPRVVAVDAPGAELAQVAVAARALAGSGGERAALEIANAALGGGASSWLSREIRIKRGLAYDVSSDVDLRRGPGLFAVRTETRNAAAPEVAGLIVEQLRRLGAGELSATELAARKAAVLGDYVRRTETTLDLAELLAEQAADGAGPAALPAFPAAVRAATPADVRRAAARLAEPGGLEILIVGDVKRFRAQLLARYPQAEIVGARDHLRSEPAPAG